DLALLRQRLVAAGVLVVRVVAGRELVVLGRILHVAPQLRGEEAGQVPARGREREGLASVEVGLVEGSDEVGGEGSTQVVADGRAGGGERGDGALGHDRGRARQAAGAGYHRCMGRRAWLRAVRV